jgi:hypothetical protein
MRLRPPRLAAWAWGKPPAATWDRQVRDLDEPRWRDTQVPFRSSGNGR